ncbi:hypothetical protein LSTR_LSTR015459 [Laodelphax striatellus]|uniref:Uncharacterized protein n=1 Tax=Laodelphax striatellus TaxID=195883 RepID=A0A482WEC1_LAOST|nr:hypothetical protein LSTR_LSTR015459 [Laodelphax striatellus]
MDSLVLVPSLPGFPDAVKMEETLTIEDDEVEEVDEELIEDEEEEAELTERQETTLPIAFVKLYRIEMLERVARAHHRKQSLDEYPEVMFREFESACEQNPSCSTLKGLARVKCVRECISPSCYYQIYYQDELEEGEIDVRLNSFKGCFVRNNGRHR